MAQCSVALLNPKRGDSAGSDSMISAYNRCATFAGPVVTPGLVSKDRTTLVALLPGAVFLMVHICVLVPRT